ncbi:MAG: ADOP family duplicated permease [Betaproteobacteria bacterium]
MPSLLRRVWHLLRQRRLDDELAEEMAFHRGMLERELEMEGAAPKDAQLAARRRFGSGALARDRARDVWIPPALQGLGQDLRLAVRTLWSARLVSTVAVLSLALGIGANTALFSLVDSLLLRVLPVKDPGRLVLLGDDRPSNLDYWSYPVWRQLRHHDRLFDGLAAWSSERLDLARGGESDYVDGLWVTGTYFDVLGVRPLAGRLLTESDERDARGSAGAAAVISYAFWQKRFGGSTAALGRTFYADGVPVTTVGVTPPGFFGMEVGRRFDIALPLGAEPLVHAGRSWLNPESFAEHFLIVGRLRSGITPRAATAVLRSVQPGIREATLPHGWPQAFLDQYLKHPFTLIPAATGYSSLRTRYEKPLLALLAIAGLVLLVACGNLANLLLARATARRQELSVRRALGASRWRLVRQLSVESLLLAGSGAALGLLVAVWASRLLVHQLSLGVTETGPNVTTKTVFLSVALDIRVLGFTLVVTLVTIMLFGVLPALRASRVSPTGSLKTDGLRVAATGLSGALVVAQVALSLVLVVAAGLFTRTLASLVSRPLGFDRDHVFVVSVDAGRAPAPAAGPVDMYRRVRDAVAALPGVASVSFSSLPPIVNGGGLLGQPIKHVSGEATLPPTGRPSQLNLIAPGWFRTLRIPIVAGRDVSDGDRLGAPPVVIVNEAFVQRFVPDGDPIGRSIDLFLPGPPPPPVRIVGVVADAIYARSLRGAMAPTIYLPLAQCGPAWRPFLLTMHLLLRSRGNGPALLTRTVAAAIARVEPRLALTFHTIDEAVDISTSQERLVATLAASFGLLALLLAGLGLYGVTAYGVARRRGEIGIRMALGAGPGGIVRLVVSNVARLVGAGLAAGVVVGVWASSLVRSLLYGVAPGDPFTFAAAALVLLFVAGLAAWIPARRASRIDPATALKCL